MVYKEYNNIPMLRPGIDYMLAGVYTYDKKAYNECMKSEKVKELLKTGSLQFPHHIFGVSYTEENQNLYSASIIDPKKCVGKILSFDIENHTCNIALKDNDIGICARKILDDKENNFAYIGVNSLGKTDIETKVFTPKVFLTCTLLTLPRNSEYYTKYFADYPLKGTYFDNE